MLSYGMSHDVLDNHQHSYFGKKTLTIKKSTFSATLQYTLFVSASLNACLVLAVNEILNSVEANTGRACLSGSPFVRVKGSKRGNWICWNIKYRTVIWRTLYYHSSLRRRIQVSYPNLFTFLRHLQNVTAENTDVAHFRNGINKRHSKKKRKIQNDVGIKTCIVLDVTFLRIETCFQRYNRRDRANCNSCAPSVTASARTRMRSMSHPEIINRP